MKILLLFVLTFSILADFTSASIAEIESSNCEAFVGCVDTDLHSTSDKNQKSESNDHHSHCHLGHSHNVIMESSIVGMPMLPIKNKESILYPLFSMGKPQNYNSDINRPPIS